MNLNRLDLNLLVALDALLTECSITRAATRLHLSPSATSGALSRLRDFFSDDLLTQVGRNMVLTPLGEGLRQGVRDCLLHIEATVNARPTFDAISAKQTFKLMMSDYLSSVLMPPVLSRLQDEAPHVSIELLGVEAVPWKSLERGEVDFLIMPRLYAEPVEHPSETLFSDECVAVLWTGNTLVEDDVSLEEMMRLGHVTIRLGGVLGKFTFFIDDALHKVGYERRIDVVTMNFTSVFPLLIGTNRIAFLPRRLAKLYCGPLPLRMVPIPLALPVIEEAIIWHRYRDQDPARIWLHGLLKQAAQHSVGSQKMVNPTRDNSEG